MKPLYTQEEFETANSNDKILPLQCEECSATFYASRHNIKDALNPGQKSTLRYCSLTCLGNSKKTKQKVVCKQCSVTFEKLPNQIKKSKNHFCSRSCAATYNNTHKTYGTRRSKLEIYLERQIRKHYPDLKLLPNDKTAINSELDFYFPDLNFAIELNGIFHYEPIYGEEKLQSIQENDERKFFLCQQNKISLAIIDSSTCSYLSKNNKNKYWNITKSIIDKHLATI